MRDTIWVYLGSEQYEAPKRSRPAWLRRGSLGAALGVVLCACVCVRVCAGSRVCVCGKNGSGVGSAAAFMSGAVDGSLEEDAKVEAEVGGVLSENAERLVF